MPWLLQSALRDWGVIEVLRSFWLVLSLCSREGPECSQACELQFTWAVLTKVEFGQLIWCACLMMQPHTSAVISLSKLPQTKLHWLHYCISNHWLYCMSLNPNVLPSHLLLTAKKFLDTSSICFVVCICPLLLDIVLCIWWPLPQTRPTPFP